MQILNNLNKRMFFNLFKIIIFHFEYFIFVDFSIAIEFLRTILFMENKN